MDIDIIARAEARIEKLSAELGELDMAALRRRLDLLELRNFIKLAHDLAAETPSDEPDAPVAAAEVQTETASEPPAGAEVTPVSVESVAPAGEGATPSSPAPDMAGWHGTWVRPAKETTADAPSEGDEVAIHPADQSAPEPATAAMPRLAVAPIQPGPEASVAQMQADVDPDGGDCAPSAGRSEGIESGHPIPDAADALPVATAGHPRTVVASHSPETA
ncbi:MAG: hypothetical protein WD472_11340, partial [Dehalococcoidia bacterium]